MKFEKWQALGNDYVIIEADALPWQLTPTKVRMICEPHFGCGADGVLLLDRSDKPGHVARLRIFNPDGSEAELSGNGAREAALYIKQSGWTDESEFSIDTDAGEIKPTVLSPTTCTIEMGRAELVSNNFPGGADDGRGTVTASGRQWNFQHVHIGNPQCVIDVGDELESIDLTQIGPQIESADIFPNKTNVSFIRRNSPAETTARIFERGVGETMSSGTGACGAAVASMLAGAESPVTIRMDGGDLQVEVGDELDLKLKGWAVPVFSGTFSEEFVDRLGKE